MEEQNVQNNKRPVFLTVLCILTFIATGLGLLFGIIGLFAAGAIESIAAYLPAGTDSGILMSIVLLVLIGASLYGAIQMWNLKKLGFYIYSAANVVMLIVSFSIFSLAITAGFIVMYYLNLKAME